VAACIDDHAQALADGFGMHGSGLFIINPPWTLPATLKTVMPWLTRTLAVDDGAKFELEFKIWCRSWRWRAAR
jgi:23S rRNA A2030 N6-methylase RlmJ